MLFAPYVCYYIFSKVKVTEWPPIGKIAAHSAYDMYSWYKYLIVSLVFSHLGFWSGNLFLIAPLPDRCLLVPFQTILETLNSPTLVQNKLQVSTDRRLCFVGKSFVYPT